VSRPLLPIIRPWMDEREVEAAGRAILSGWVTQGPEVEAFEREFATYVGAAHAVAVSSCTTALHLALLAVGVGPGDEVITASHSFIATANSIRYCGATPVFVDIDPLSFNIDPTLVESAITPRTRAILAVHQMGMPAELRRLVPLARERGIPLIEDAACAIGSELRNDDGTLQKIGAPHGDVGCFSFHPRKVMSTGDGGMLTTSSEKLASAFRLLRHHGMSVADRARHEAREVAFESYPVVGFNYRMTDIQAAVGRVQLTRMPAIVGRRRELAARYAELLRQRAPSVTAPHEPEWARTNWQSYCVRLPAGADQRGVMQKLLDRGIATRRGIMCTHREGAYADGSSWRSSGGLTESEKAQDEGVLLPLFHQMTTQEQERVVDALAEAITG
jgi:perosamine synthetase